MVKSGKLQLALRHLHEVMDVSAGAYKNLKVDSLEKALELAMRTIYLSSDGVSGKATYLSLHKEPRKYTHGARSNSRNSWRTGLLANYQGSRY